MPQIHTWIFLTHHGENGMKKKGMEHFMRLAGSILAAAFLFLSTGPAVHAQKPPDSYWVKIYFGADKSVCVGQTTTLAVAYKLKKGEVEKAPPSFSFQVTNGNVTSPNPTSGGTGSGFVFFNFTATEPGEAVLFAEANQGDGSDMTTIKVKKDCEYSYNLVVTLRAASALDGVVFSWKDSLKTKGTFKPVAADLAPIAPLSPNGTIDTTLMILDEGMSDQDECNVPATVWTGLTGSGTEIVSGQMLQNGSQAGVQILINAVQIKHSPTFATPCKHGTISKSIPLDFSESYWVHEDFPADGGSRQIKIDLFEKGVANLNEAPGTEASYDAFLEVRRVR
jgi:hypothetical protein